MRIHGDSITAADIRAAANAAQIDVLAADPHGSRIRERAYEVALSGSGSVATQYGSRDSKSATWDEWGIFLAHLFAADDTLTIPRVYESHDMFTWATGGFYEPFQGDRSHKRHSWEYLGLSFTGSYYVQECRKCSAIRRYMAHGHSFSEIAA